MPPYLARCRFRMALEDQDTFLAGACEIQCRIKNPGTPRIAASSRKSAKNQSAPRWRMLPEDLGRYFVRKLATNTIFFCIKSAIHFGESCAKFPHKNTTLKKMTPEHQTMRFTFQIPVYNPENQDLHNPKTQGTRRVKISLRPNWPRLEAK